MKGHPRQRNQEGYNAPIMDNPLEVYPPHTSPYGSFQQQPRMTTEIPQVSPSMGSPYQQNAYQRQAPGNPPFLAHAMPFQTGLPIDQAQTQMVYLSYPNSYPQLIPQIMPQQHQFPAAIPQSRPQFPRYANQSQPFVQPRFSQSNNPAQYFTPFPHTNGQVPLQVPPTTQQPPPQKRERKPLAIVDPNTNEEVSISPDSVSRSRSESTSEGPKQPDNSEQIKVEFAKQVAATIGESPPVDVPSSVESSVVDQVEQRKEKQKRERKKDKAEQAQEVCNEERRRQEKQEHRGELLHFEEERQRSPVNPQDAKKYTKEFLKTMRDSPLAKVSPKIPAELSATGPSLELETMGTAWYLESTWSMPQKEMNGLSQGKGGHTSEIAINIPVVQKKGALTPGPLTKQKVVDVQEKQNNTEQRKEKKKRRRKKDKTEEAQEVCNEERKGQEKQEHRGELFLHFEEERKQFEEEKVKFYQDQMKLEKEYTRKSRKMDKRKQDIEKQLHEERNRNERLEMEKEHLRGEQLRLEKELKVFKEEIRKFEQEKVELKREAELKYEQEKKHIEEKWAKELIKHQKQFEDTRKLLEKERIEKVEELEKQLDEEKQRTHDNENQIQQEREKTERKKEVEEQNLYRGLLRLQEERKLFEEEMRKFDQEKIQLEEEAERKNDQEKRLLEERARLVEELKKQLKKEQHFQEEKKRQQEERRKKQQQEEKRREAEEEKRKKAINEEICRIEEERRRVEEEKQQAKEKKIKEEEIRLLKLEEEWLKSKHKEEMSLLEKKRNDALKYIRSQTTHRSLTSNSSLVKNDSSLDETIDADHIEDAPKEKLQKGLNPALSDEPEATLRFVIPNFTKAPGRSLSDATVVRNLYWRISTRYMAGGTLVPLQCNSDSESTSWNCQAVAELRLVSQKKGVENFTRKIQHRFCSKYNKKGFFIWTDIFREGYIKDDCIILEVHLVAEAPGDVSLDSKEHAG